MKPWAGACCGAWELRTELVLRITCDGEGLLVDTPTWVLLASATQGQASEGEQRKRSCGGLGHELPFSSFVCIDGIYTADVYIFKA